MRRTLLVILTGVTMGCSGGGASDGDDSQPSGGTAGGDSGGASAGGKSIPGGTAGADAKSAGTGGKAAGTGGKAAGTAGKSAGAGTSSGGSSGSGQAGAPPQAGSKFEAGDCGLDAPAFCEDFETSHPGGRGGDLNEVNWSFARWAHSFQYFWLRVPASTYPDAWTPATFCGTAFQNILPPNDVKICDGLGVDKATSKQLNEVFDDQSDFGFQSMRIRQPFDFTDRTGKIVWDVDAKYNPLNQGHGWWIEVWITEDPSPLPYHEAPTVSSIPRNALGLAFRFSFPTCEDTDTSWGNALESVHVTKDNKILHFYDDIGWEDDELRCFKSMDRRMNHFELRVNKDKLEFWASDYENIGSFKKRAEVANLDLPFSRGYVHFQHAHYNAAKDGLEGCEEGVPGTCPSRSQTFRWDNIGFDGPAYPTPRGYDVADNDAPGPEDTDDNGKPLPRGVFFGWELNDGMSERFTVPNVSLAGAQSASFNFTVMMALGQELEYRFNDGSWQSFIIPGEDGSENGVRGFSVPAPLEDLVEGNNEVEVRVPNPLDDNGIGNMDITIEVQ